MSQSVSSGSNETREISEQKWCCRWFGGKKKAVAEESEPDEFGQLEKLELEYQEEMRRKVRSVMDSRLKIQKLRHDHKRPQESCRS